MSFIIQKKISKKKKDFPASRLAFILATRWIGNKLFVKGGLGLVYAVGAGAVLMGVKRGLGGGEWSELRDEEIHGTITCMYGI